MYWVHPTKHWNFLDFSDFFVDCLIVFLLILLIYFCVFCFSVRIPTILSHNRSVCAFFSIPLTTVLFKFVLLVQWVLIIIIICTHTQAHRIIYLLLLFLLFLSLTLSLYLHLCFILCMGLNEYMLELNEKQYWTECYCAVCVLCIGWTLLCCIL